MADPYIVTEFQTGIEFSKYMKYLKYKFQWNDAPFGYQIDNASTDPKVSFIDKYETVCTPPPDFFYNHELYLWTKCLLSEAGVVTEDKEKDRNGFNLDKTGASGDVMTWIPNGQYAYKWEEDADVQIFKYAPYYSNHRGFDYHPNCYQGGGTKHDHFYWGTYLAGLKDDNGTLKLNSCSGVQPLTGGEMKYLSFTSGGPNAFTVGETLTNAATGATGIVVSYHTTSGTSWAAGDMAGVVYLRQCTGTSGAGQLNGSTSGTDCATSSGASTALPLTIDNALTYASNKGAGWSITGIYDLVWIQGLLYGQWLSRDSQSVVGRGIVDLPVGTGYAGLLNGANNIDLSTNLNAYGTGIGDGINGQTPIEVNNICDAWGGCFTFVSGINFFSSNGTDGSGNTYTANSYRVTKRDGTGTIAGTLPAGSYETGAGTVPTSDAYYFKVQTDQLGALLYMPTSTVNGDVDKGYCDKWIYPRYSPSNMLVGGDWTNRQFAGVGSRSANCSPLSSYTRIGARLKYIPQS